MLTEPISVTVNATPHSLPRVQAGSHLTGTPSVYQNSDETVILHVQNQKTAKKRAIHTFRLDQRKIVTNPVDSTTDWDAVSVLLKIDRPEYGWTATEIDYLVAALKAQLTTALVTKLYGYES